MIIFIVLFHIHIFSVICSSLLCNLWFLHGKVPLPEKACQVAIHGYSHQLLVKYSNAVLYYLT